MPIDVFDHYTVRAADLDKSVRFYEALGLKANVGSGLGFRIALMRLGDHAIVHLLEAGPDLDGFLGRSGPSTAGNLASHASNFEHAAFRGSDLTGVRKALKAQGARFTERTLREEGPHQVLAIDPDGVEVEINFTIEDLRAAGPA